MIKCQDSCTFGMQGHFLRAVSLENLGNYKECLKSYLKAYELDTAHPTELLLHIIGAVGCICQMSEREELTLSDEGKICDHWAGELKWKEKEQLLSNWKNKKEKTFFMVYQTVLKTACDGICTR